jgi:hypothetical protein
LAWSQSGCKSFRHCRFPPARRGELPGRDAVCANRSAASDWIWLGGRDSKPDEPVSSTD